MLAAQIFLAVAGEFDYQKASTLALVLLMPDAARLYCAALLGQPPLVYFGDRQTGQRAYSGQRTGDPLVVYQLSPMVVGIDRGDVCLDFGRLVQQGVGD